MQLEVENLGVVKKASINLDKPLILFTGRNNSGKTYVSYLIYGIYSGKFADWVSFIPGPIEIELKQKNSYTFNAKEFWQNYHVNLLNQISESLYDNLSLIFNLNETLFESTKIELFDNNIFLTEKSLFVSSALFKRYVGENQYWHFEEASQKIYVNDNFIKHGNIETSEILKIADSIYSIYISLLFRDVYFLMAERNAFLLYAKELIQLRQIIRSSKVSGALLKEMPQHQLPISDNEIFNAFIRPNPQKKFFDIALEIESALLNGKIYLDENSNFFFIPNDSPQLRLPIHGGGSSIKSLADLIVILKYSVDPGDLLIFDEPELNLHPDNQRILARFLVKLINNGLRLVVSTHSDYIIREINNMVMLGCVPDERKEEKAAMMKEFGFQDEMQLKKEQLGAYFFNAGEVSELQVTNLGFGVKTIDDTIEDLSRQSEDIFYLLKG